MQSAVNQSSLNGGIHVSNHKVTPNIQKGN
jgi:hypothetical protein